MVGVNYDNSDWSYWLVALTIGYIGPNFKYSHHTHYLEGSWCLGINPSRAIWIVMLST